MTHAKVVLNIYPRLVARSERSCALRFTWLIGLAALPGELCAGPWLSALMNRGGAATTPTEAMSLVDAPASQLEFLKSELFFVFRRGAGTRGPLSS